MNIQTKNFVSRFIDYAVFAAVSALVAVRLFIWRFYTIAEPQEKPSLSNNVVAICVFFVLIIFVMHTVLSKRKLISSGFDLWILGYLLVGAVSIVYSIERNQSAQTFMYLVAQVALFYMLVNVLSRRQHFDHFIYFFFVMAMVVVLWGIRDYIYLMFRDPLPVNVEVTNENKSLIYVLRNKRITSLLGWPNVLASFMMLVIPLGAVFTFLNRNRFGLRSILAGVILVGLIARLVYIFPDINWVVFSIAILIFLICALYARRVFFGICTLGMIVTMFLTFSIAGWFFFLLATIVSLTVYFVIRKSVKFNKTHIISFLLIIAVGAAGMTYIVQKRKILKRGISNSPRVQYLVSGIEMVKQRPVFGHGYNTFQFGNRPFVKTAEGYSSYTHCTPLQIWAELGVLGVFFMGGLLFMIFKSGILALKREDYDKRDVYILFALMWAMSAFLIHNLVSFTLIKPNISYFWWIMLAVYCALLNHINKKYDDLYLERVSNKRLIGANVSLMVAAMLIFALTKIYAGEKYYYDGVRLWRAEIHDNAYHNFLMAKESNPFDGRYDATLGQVYYQFAVRKKDKRFLTPAFENTRVAIQRMPVVYQNYITMAQILKEKGNIERAKAFHRKGRALAPYKFNQPAE